MASACLETFGSSLFNFLNFIVWLRITDEGSVPDIRTWSILLIKSLYKWSIHLCRSLFIYFKTANSYHRSFAESCCPCAASSHINDTEAIQKRIEEIKRTLTVPRNSTNSFQWSKMCMADDRTSSRTIGYVLGIGLLTALLAFIVLPDLPVMAIHMNYRWN